MPRKIDTKARKAKAKAKVKQFRHDVSYYKKELAFFETQAERTMNWYLRAKEKLAKAQHELFLLENPTVVAVTPAQTEAYGFTVEALPNVGQNESFDGLVVPVTTDDGPNYEKTTT